MKDKPLEEWKPRNRVEMDAYRKRLVEIITPTAVSCAWGFGCIFDIYWRLKNAEME